jgi:hypothetical protein
VLAVGDSTKLEVIFSTENYEGWITKQPSILTNEGEDSIVAYHYVQIRSNVTTEPESTYYPIRISPSKLNISQFTDSLRDETTLQITNLSDTPGAITMIDVPEDYLEVTLPESLAVGQASDATIKMNPNSITTSFKKSITIEVDDEEGTRFTIPVERVYNPQ